MSEPVLGTACRDCVFAKFWNNKQDGCSLNRLEKFAANGARILSQKDDEKEYFLITNRFCNTCFNAEWASKIPKRQWQDEAMKICAIKLDIVIVANDDIQKCLETIDTAISQSMPTGSINVVFNPNVPEAKIVEVVSYLQNNAGVKWRVETIPLAQLIKEKLKNVYFAQFWAGHKIKPDLVKKLNIILNHRLERIMAVVPDGNGNGLILQRKACFMNLEEIMIKAKEENLSHFIKEYKEYENWNIDLL